VADGGCARLDALYAGSPLLAERLQWFERGSAAYEARLAQGKELGIE